jgi:hypothetical protein
MWPDDLENPDAMRKLFDSEQLGRDIAGNSFTGTVVQAVGLVAMAGTNFLSLMQCKTNEPRKPASGAACPAAPPKRRADGDSPVNPAPKRYRLFGKQQHSRLHQSSSPGGPSGSADAPRPGHKGVIKRALKKQFDPSYAQTPVKKQPAVAKNRPGGNRGALGKRASSSIWEKEMLFQEYDRLCVELGRKAANKEFATKKPKGFFQAGSCVSRFSSVFLWKSLVFLGKSSVFLSFHSEKLGFP